MVRCNLSILLAERNLKISKVSKDTGLSRTTLTSLNNNYSQGVQFDTINTLCTYLKITPDQLISYIPVDITINHVDLTDNILEVTLIIFKNNKSYVCGLTGTCYPSFSDDLLDNLDITIELFSNYDNDEDLAQENSIIINAFNLLTIPFLNDIETIIFREIISKFDDVADSLTYSFVFDDVLTSACRK